MLFNKVTIKGAKQAVQMFGPAQHAVAKAVADSVAEGVIPADEADDLFICVGVFIHWDAADDKKIQDFNYRATKEAIARAVSGEPTRRRRGPSAQHREASVRRQLNGKNGGPYGPPVFNSSNVMSVNGTASVPNCKFTPLVPDVTPVTVSLRVNGIAACRCLSRSR